VSAKDNKAVQVWLAEGPGGVVVMAQASKTEPLKDKLDAIEKTMASPDVKKEVQTERTLQGKAE
jgi:hypothetical protein